MPRYSGRLPICHPAVLLLVTAAAVLPHPATAVALLAGVCGSSSQHFCGGSSCTTLPPDLRWSYRDSAAPQLGDVYCKLAGFPGLASVSLSPRETLDVFYMNVANGFDPRVTPLVCEQMAQYNLYGNTDGSECLCITSVQCLEPTTTTLTTSTTVTTSTQSTSSTTTMTNTVSSTTTLTSSVSSTSSTLTSTTTVSSTTTLTTSVSSASSTPTSTTTVSSTTTLTTSVSSTSSTLTSTTTVSSTTTLTTSVSSASSTPTSTATGSSTTTLTTSVSSTSSTPTSTTTVSSTTTLTTSVSSTSSTPTLTATLTVTVLSTSSTQTGTSTSTTVTPSSITLTSTATTATSTSTITTNSSKIETSSAPTTDTSSSTTSTSAATAATDSAHITESSTLITSPKTTAMSASSTATSTPTASTSIWTESDSATTSTSSMTMVENTSSTSMSAMSGTWKVSSFCADSPQLMHGNDLSDCAGLPSGSQCEMRCNDGYAPRGQLVCELGQWRVTGVCLNARAQTRTSRAVQKRFQVQAFEVGSSGALVLSLDVSVLWAEARASMLSSAMSNPLGLGPAMMRFEVLPALPASRSVGFRDTEGAPRRLQTEVTLGSFDLRVTILDDDPSSPFGPLNASLETLLGTSDLRGDIERGGFGKYMGAELLKHGEVVPVVITVGALGPMGLLDEFVVAVPEWLVDPWGDCSDECIQNRNGTCSVFGDMACEEQDGPHPIKVRRCNEHVACALKTGCLVGAWGGDCAIQATIIISSLVVACIFCGVSLVAVRHACRPKLSGTIRIGPLGLPAAYRVVRPADLVDADSLDAAKDAKTHIVWDVGREALDVYFEQQHGTRLHMCNSNSAGSDPSVSTVTPGVDISGSDPTPDARLSRSIQNFILEKRARRGLGFAQDSRISDIIMYSEPVPVPISTLAFEDGDRIEYYSQTVRRWAAGIVQVVYLKSSRSRASLSSGSSLSLDLGPSVRYDVRVSLSGQVRHAVTLDLIRHPLTNGESVEVLTGTAGGSWAPAVIAGAPGPSATTLGYMVAADGSGKLLENVQAHRLRRRFNDGAAVQVYRGADRGWVHAEVCEDGIEPLAMISARPGSDLPRLIGSAHLRGSKVGSAELQLPCADDASLVNAGASLQAGLPSSASTGLCEMWLWAVIRETGLEEPGCDRKCEWCPSHLLRQQQRWCFQ
mmetsp:Transcript_173739/g.551590  ORF Transcript_173739/g.551590 Transcript_173739/m.551590 type:complete len:1178 (-) Transcript_173739:436-3969(-)